MKLSRVGVDLAKNVYQLYGVDRHEKTLYKRRLPRKQWLQMLLDKAEPSCEVCMEACAGAAALLDKYDICALKDNND